MRRGTLSSSVLYVVSGCYLLCNAIHGMGLGCQSLVSGPQMGFYFSSAFCAFIYSRYYYHQSSIPTIHSDWYDYLSKCLSLVSHSVPRAKQVVLCAFLPLSVLRNRAR